MPDQEFEKQVRQKMEELRFRPSDAVWQQVQQHRRRQRWYRRAAVWVPVMAVTSYALGFWIYRSVRPAASESDQLVQHSTVPSRPDKPHDAMADNATAYPSTPNSAPAGDQPAEAVTKQDPLQPVTTDQPVTSGQELADASAPRSLSTVKKDNPSRSVATLEEQKPEKAEVVIAQAPGKENTTVAKAEQPTMAATQQATVSPVVQQEATVVTAADPDAGLILFPAAVQGLPGDNAYATTLDLTAGKVEHDMAGYTAPLPAPQKAFSRAQPWKWGVEAGGGISNMIDGGLLPLKDAAVADQAQMSYAVAGIPLSNKKPSEIESAGAVSLGAFGQYQFTRKLTVTAGLRYRRLNTRIKTGKRIRDSIALVNRAGNYAAARVTNFFEAEKTRTYTNYFHFVEVPVELQWQLTNSRKWPLYWTNGLALSQLVGSNALHFDGSTGVYYNDNSLFNRTQWSASSAVMLGIRADARTSFQVGPQVQYHLTNMLKDASTGKKYLLYVGINARLIIHP